MTSRRIQQPRTINSIPHHFSSSSSSAMYGSTSTGAAAAAAATHRTSHSISVITTTYRSVLNSVHANMKYWRLFIAQTAVPLLVIIVMPSRRCALRMYNFQIPLRYGNYYHTDYRVSLSLIHFLWLSSTLVEERHYVLPLDLLLLLFLNANLRGY